jgi:hypothetical protein
VQLSVAITASRRIHQAGRKSRFPERRLRADRTPLPTHVRLVTGKAGFSIRLPRATVGEGISEGELLRAFRQTSQRKDGPGLP